jgi:hypothetical protein
MSYTQENDCTEELFKSYLINSFFSFAIELRLNDLQRAYDLYCLVKDEDK